MKTLARLIRHSSFVMALLAVSALAQPALPTNVVALAPRHGVIALQWEANPETNLAGYFVHYGPASRNYTNAVWAGLRTNFNLGVNETTPLFLALTAVNTLGLASDPSNEVTATASTNRPAPVRGLVTVVIVNGLSASRYPDGPWQPVEGVTAYVKADDAARFFRSELSIRPGPVILAPP